jgi:hypothetical protein
MIIGLLANARCFGLFFRYSQRKSPNISGTYNAYRLPLVCLRYIAQIKSYEFNHWYNFGASDEYKVRYQ